MTKTSVILLGRSGYTSAPVLQIQALVNNLQQSANYTTVHAAFIDQGSPSLPEALDACLHDTVERVLVVPVYLPSDRGLEVWLAKVIKRWLYHRQPQPFEVGLINGLGDAPELGDALIRLLERTNQEVILPLAANGIRPNSPEWSVIPPARKHVLVCRGPRCNTAGAGRTAAHLSKCLQTQELGDEDVLVAQTGCLFPCNLGPVMVVYPDGVWYSGLTEDAVERIVEEHFVGGQIVDHFARYPMAQALKRPVTDSGDDQEWEAAL